MEKNDKSNTTSNLTEREKRAVKGYKLKEIQKICNLSDAELNRKVSIAKKIPALQNLSRSQIASFYAYTYHGDEWLRQITQRKGATTPEEKQNGAEALYDNIEAAFKQTKGLPKDTILLRGTTQWTMAQSVGVKSFKDIKVGNEVETKIYFSCATGNLSNDFNYLPVQLRINAPSGTKAIDIQNISHFKKENETLLNKNTKMKVTKIEKKDDITYIDLEVIK